jgi:hypothetical protein
MEQQFAVMELDQLVLFVEADSHLLRDVDPQAVALARQVVELEGREREISALRRTLHRLLPGALGTSPAYQTRGVQRHVPETADTPLLSSDRPVEPID